MYFIAFDKVVFVVVKKKAERHFELLSGLSRYCGNVCRFVS